MWIALLLSVEFTVNKLRIKRKGEVLLCTNICTFIYLHSAVVCPQQIRVAVGNCPGEVNAQN
jgi:hypothetical protein